MQNLSLDWVEQQCARISLKVRNINDGGCGLFTLGLYKLLSPFFDCSVAVFHFDPGAPPLDSVRGKLRRNHLYAWCDQGVVIDHFMLELKIGAKVYLLDSEGLVEPRVNYRKIQHKTLGELHLNKNKMPIAELQELVYIEEGWCPLFNKAQKKKVIQFFKKLDVQL